MLRENPLTALEITCNRPALPGDPFAWSTITNQPTCEASMDQ